MKATKKLLAVALAAVMAIAPITTVDNTQKVSAATEQVVNFAEGKTVISSSNESNEYLAQYAVDGDMNTRWSSSFNDGEWIMVDLGDIYAIGSIRIFWEAAYAANYTVSWSQDNVTWYDASTMGVSSYSTETSVMFYNRPVRYIKVTCNRRGTAYGVSIFELQALGLATVPETTTEAPETTTEAPTVNANTNLALGKPVVASSVESADYLAEYAVDGDMNTRWSSAFRDGEYITVDLGKIYAVGSVSIYWEAAYASSYSIYWSQDNVTWNEACTMGQPAYSPDTCNMFFNRPVRYIRIKCNTRATAYGVSIYEIVIRGEEYTGQVYRRY
ncbi:MAG: discoidin domain-containing protein [Lachnospiraceae bacterium]|nr:discoidin domain-containing protein [Lachnospiraceae bacterium]